MKPSSVIISMALAMCLAGVGKADELDQVTTTKPAGVLVKVDPKSREINIYKADEVDPRILTKSVENLSEAERRNVVEEEVAKVAVPENLIGHLEQAPDELDRDSSTAACWYRSWGAGWGWRGWGGYYGGYNWYRPWSYPGQFYYGAGWNYGYGYGYGYGGCNYGWYW